MDFRIFEFINQLAGKSGILDGLMVGLAKYGVLLMAIPLLLIWFRSNEEGKKAALLSLLSMAVALLINQFIGHLYFRDRPFVFHDVNLLLDKSTDPSFPSDHTTFVFGIAWLLLFKNRRIGALAIGLAALVGTSRVFVGTHYPADVLGGALVGLGSAILVWKARNALNPITSFIVSLAKKLKLA
ncbi:MAG: undecaprenyl-diphosphatase [Thermoleophilia bacterium]